MEKEEIKITTKNSRGQGNPKILTSPPLISTNTDTSTNPAPKKFSEFKKSEKKYKRLQSKKTDFSTVIDLNSSTTYPGIYQSTITHPKTKLPLKMFTFENPAGLIIIKKYTQPQRQLFLCQRALNAYIQPPHRTNMYIYDDEDYKKDPTGHKAGAYNRKTWIVDEEDSYHFNKKVRWSNLGK